MKILYELSWLWETLGIALVAAAVCMACAALIGKVFKGAASGIRSLRHGLMDLDFEKSTNWNLWRCLMLLAIHLVMIMVFVILGVIFLNGKGAF